MIKTNYLALSWSLSRGRDTYGYNIVRLDDRETGQRYKCMGGGYDMIGTCVGQWLSTEHQARLMEIQGNASMVISEKFGYIANPGDNRLYGMTHDQKRNRVLLDGACGLERMIAIAAAIGISISRNSDKKGRTVGFMVTDYGSAEALRAATIGGN